ncbi:unnamed protein product, partial [Discosporangium mesarthrocarpum]
MGSAGVGGWGTGGGWLSEGAEDSSTTSVLRRVGSGVGGLAMGALAAAAGSQARRSILVDKSIQRADMIARTYERVANSHTQWVWTGADDLAWAGKAWRKRLASLRGELSLWEGGLFGRLMLSPEAAAAAEVRGKGMGSMGVMEVR